MRVPLEIRIFLWQLTHGPLPSRSEVLKRNDQEDGCCLMCGIGEDFTYIFFLCMVARFLSGCVREALGCNWCPADLQDLVVNIESLAGRRRCLLLLSFAAMAWVLWTSRNKLVIVHGPSQHATDLIFIYCFYAAVMASCEPSGVRHP